MPTILERARAMLAGRKPMGQNRRKQPGQRKWRTQREQLHQLDMEEKAAANARRKRASD